MKKQLLIAAACLLSLASCKKEDQKSCWECTVKSVFTYPGEEDTNSETKIEQCDYTEEQIRQLEKSGTTTTTQTSNGVTYTQKTTTNCAKK